jgi:putative membrane protein
MKSASHILVGLYLIAMPIYCLLRVYNSAWVNALTIAMPVLLSGFTLLHLVATRGVIRGLIMSLCAVSVSFLAEFVGVSTGRLFGNYSYTDLLGTKIFGVVPILIPCAWLMLVYPCWECMRAWEKNMGLQIFYSALAVTAYDLSLDPRMVLDGYWVWHGGGVYFGIPLSNFVGWFLTASVIFILWQKLDRAPSSQPDSPSPKLTLPIFIYVVLWLGETVANVFFWSGAIIGVIVFVAMGIFVLPLFNIISIPRARKTKVSQ